MNLLECRRIPLVGKKKMIGTFQLNLRILIGTYLLNLGILIVTYLLKSVPPIFELAVLQQVPRDFLPCQCVSVN